VLGAVPVFVMKMLCYASSPAPSICCWIHPHALLRPCSFFGAAAYSTAGSPARTAGGTLSGIAGGVLWRAHGGRHRRYCGARRRHLTLRMITLALAQLGISCVLGELYRRREACSPFRAAPLWFPWIWNEMARCTTCVGISAAAYLLIRRIVQSSIRAGAQGDPENEPRASHSVIRVDRKTAGFVLSADWPGWPAHSGAGAWIRDPLRCESEHLGYVILMTMLGWQRHVPRSARGVWGCATLEEYSRIGSAPGHRGYRRIFVCA